MKAELPPSAWSIFGIFAALLVLHLGAIGAGWAYDDPVHLQFVLKYSPWEYFTSKAVMLEQSYAHITPWNAFFYEIGIPWAGLDARLHHVHLVAVVAASAVATWMWGQHWLGAGGAFMAAVLFLAMPSTAVVVRMLMTGHYAYGLLFSILALSAWTLAVKRERHGWAVLAAALYGLACLCKELFAPLPLVFLAWPLGTLSFRIRLLIPSALVAAGYAALRWHVLGGTGGYVFAAGNFDQLLFKISDLAQILVRLWFGWGWTGVAACLLWLVLVLTWLWRRQLRTWVLLSACVVAIALPIVPIIPAVLVVNGHESSARWFFVLAWAVALMAAVALRKLGRWKWPGFLLLFGLLVAGQRILLMKLPDEKNHVVQQNGLLVDAPKDTILVPYLFHDIGYLRSMADAVARWHHVSATRIVANEEELALLGPALGRAAQTWNAQCRCIEKLGRNYDQRVQELKEKISQGAGRPISVNIGLEGSGTRRIFRWHVEGANGQVQIDENARGQLSGLPLTGQLEFGLDVTFRLEASVNVRVTLMAEDGAWLRSPVLTLPSSPGHHESAWFGLALPLTLP